jgi:hypothetical protein
MVPFKEDGKVPRTFPEERGERKQYALAAMGKARVFYLFFGRQNCVRGHVVTLQRVHNGDEDRLAAGLR